MINLMEYNKLGSENISLLVDNARKCNVNFHNDLIEPDQKILTYTLFRNIVILTNIHLAGDTTAPE